MIKKLLSVTLLALCSFSASAQFDNIGLLGGSTVTGWASDTDMLTTDGITYTLDNVVLTEAPEGADPGVKFRKDDAWEVNWGGNTFPSGTAIPGGGNIQVAPGTYNVTFNKNTLAYSFVNVQNFQSVSFLGQFNSWTDVPMITFDGITYTLSNFTVTAGGAKFRQTGSWLVNWGSTAFPSGVGVQDGPDIPLAAGTYNITFNRQTGAYSFTYVTLSIIGNAAAGWNTDIPLQTTDGNTYTLANQVLTTGELKFRVNNNYGVANWGGTAFPSGTGVPDGPNIQVTAGTYDITFNRLTAAYSFEAVINGTTEFEAAGLVVYPNPTQNSWNFTFTAAERITLADISGKIITDREVNGTSAVIDATGLTPGLYFATVYSGSSAQVMKLLKN